MSQVVDAVAHILSPRQTDRIGLCGAPMPTMVRADGETVSGAHFRCTSRYCVECAKRRRQRVWACLTADLADVLRDDKSRPYLLTVTFRSGRSFQRAYRDIARLQRAAHAQLREYDYCCERVRHWWSRGDRPDKVRYWESRRRAAIPHPSETYPDTPQGRRMAAALDEAKLDSFCSTWSDDHAWHPTDGDRTDYIWCKEATTGATCDRAHVHLHYIVRTREAAERLNAAYQAVRITAIGQVAMLRTDISGGPSQRYRSPSGASADCDDADPVGYLTKYISKGSLEGLADSADTDLIRDYMRGSKHQRQYDAGGSWRPIGIGRKRDDSIPPVRWLMLGDQLLDFADFVAGRGPGYALCVAAAKGDGELVERLAHDIAREAWRENGSDWAAVASVQRAKAHDLAADVGRLPARSAYLAKNRTLLRTETQADGEEWCEELHAQLLAEMGKSPPD